MKFGEIVGIIKGWNSKFPPTLARNIVNEALDFIYNDYKWGFLHEETYLIIPKMINSTATQVTQYSNKLDISSNGALLTTLDAIENNADDIRVAGRQIIVIDGDNQNIIYTINSYDSGDGWLFLDKPYMGSSKSNVQIRIFKNLFSAPQKLINNNLVTDFKKFLFISDLTDLRNLNLDTSFNELNDVYNNRGINLERISYGTPRLVTTTKIDSLGNNLYEFYPIYSITTRDRIYRVLYLRQGLKIEDDDVEIPSAISKATLLAACKIKLYEWADVNKGKDIELQKTNWLNLIVYLQNPKNEFGYIANLDKDIRNDEDKFPKAMIYNYYESNDWFDEISYYLAPPHTNLANW